MHDLRRYRVDERTTLSRRMAELGPSLTSRALIAVLSDLHDPDAVKTLKQLGQRHDCFAIQLQDPSEEGLPGAGLLRAREAETGRVFVTRAARRWTAPEEIARELLRGGVDHLLVRTDEPFRQRLRLFLRNRGLLGRRSS